MIIAAVALITRRTLIESTKSPEAQCTSATSHATMLHCLGIDHNRFTHPFRGLDVRLTGVEEAHVVRDILS